MKKSIVAAILFGFSFVSVSAPAQASGGDFALGAIVGSVVGWIAGSPPQYRHKKPYRTRSYSQRPAPRQYLSPAELQSNRDVQQQLNSLGYNAGRVDGILGRRSRAAISAFQNDAGFKSSGYLTPQQRAVLFAEKPEAVMENENSVPMMIVAPKNLVTEKETPSQLSEQTVQIEPEVTPSPAANLPLVAETTVKSNRMVRAKNTSLSFTKGAPGFYGIILGQGYESARDILAKNGYHTCSGKGDFMSCIEQQDGVRKQFKLARSSELQGQPIYLMDSETTLEVDVDQSLIEARLAKSYPELVAAPDKVISDEASCASQMADLANVDALVAKLEALQGGEDGAADWVKDALETCKLFYKADIAKIDAGYKVRVVMFKGAYLEREMAAANDEQRARVEKALDF